MCRRIPGPEHGAARPDARPPVATTPISELDPVGDGATPDHHNSVWIVLTDIRRQERHPARPRGPQPTEHRIAGHQVIALGNEHLEMEVRPEASAAAARESDLLASRDIVVEANQDPAIGPAGEVVVEGLAPVAVTDPHEVAEVAELLGPEAALGRRHDAVLGRRDRAEERHRVVEPGVVVVDPPEVRFIVVPGLAGVIELNADARIAIHAIAEAHVRVVERERVVVGRASRARTDHQRCANGQHQLRPPPQEAGHDPHSPAHVANAACDGNVAIVRPSRPISALPSNSSTSTDRPSPAKRGRIPLANLVGLPAGSVRR
jgi:hypothetical protein